ncbi:MAG: hypothetical protein QG602_1311, partial [Verrucomicrobiota bacterium]|nr:hypothetical protein [Verrucomicrobiota bacterium]
MEGMVNALAQAYRGKRVLLTG